MQEFYLTDLFVTVASAHTSLAKTARYLWRQLCVLSSKRYSQRSNEGVTRGGGKRGASPRAPNGCGGRQKVPATSQVFFNTVNLLPKDLSFEHGGTKLASCPGRHLTSLRPWLWSGSSKSCFVHFAPFLPVQSHDRKEGISASLLSFRVCILLLAQSA